MGSKGLFASQVALQQTSQLFVSLVTWAVGGGAAERVSSSSTVQSNNVMLLAPADDIDFCYSTETNCISNRCHCGYLYGR